MRMIAGLLTLLVAGVAQALLAKDAHMGTWKLNEAQSSLTPGGPKFTTVVFSATGDSVKVTVDGVDADGRPTHNEWTGKFDGRDYPVLGDPKYDTRSYRKIDDRTLEFSGKKGGKVGLTGRVVVAPDGKRWTVRESGRDAKGRRFSIAAVFDRQ